MKTEDKREELVMEGKIYITMENGTDYTLTEDPVTGNLTINKGDGHIKVLPRYSNEIEVE